MGRFLAIFAVVTVALFAAELTPPGQIWVVNPWTETLAGGIARFVTMFDSTVIASGRSLLDQSTGRGITIEQGCNGVEAVILIVAAILAFPAPWRHRLVGLAAGIVAVQGLNVVRVVSLYYLSRWNFAVFEWAHLYLWQPLIMIDVLFVWLVWLRWIPRKDAPLAA
jgi:exosortase H (IPTLxxWG-CTERM-specific)